MRTVFRSAAVGLRGLLEEGSTPLSAVIVAALFIAGIALLPLSSPSAQSGAGVPADQALPYAPVQETELARLRYEALQAQQAQQHADYDAASEIELARQRYDALQAQLAQQQHANYSAAQEIELARQRYAVLQAQWSARASEMPDSTASGSERYENMTERSLEQGSAAQVTGPASNQRQDELKDRWLDRWQ